jgi:hypothetical protein
MTPEDMEVMAIDLLKRKYFQKADKRQKAMGLSYTEAETTDLAKTMVMFAAACMARRDIERLAGLVGNPIVKQ